MEIEKTWLEIRNEEVQNDTNWNAEWNSDEWMNEVE